MKNKLNLTLIALGRSCKMGAYKAFGLVLFAIAASAISIGVEGADVPSSKANLDVVAKSELFVDYAQPIISLDEVINPTSSMDGDFPIETYGTYGGRFFWMDNHRLILSVLDKDRQTAAIESWDVDSGNTKRYGWGKIMCYADGMISKMVYQTQTGTSKMTPGVLQKGLLGQEKDFDYDKSIRVYDNTLECGDRPSVFTTQHVREHLDDIVVALRKEHGFLVKAKRTIFPDGRTDKILEQDEIVFHAPDKEPVRIQMIPWLEGYLSAYYPFVKAYAFKNMAKGEKDRSISRTLRHRKNTNGEIIAFGADGLSRLTDSAFILAVNGEVRKVKIPGVFLNGFGVDGPYLSRRGLIWLGRFVMPNEGSGLYLSRGEQVKRITSENSHDGVVSPNGCRMAYTTTHIDFFGQLTKPTLKIIDLCKGEK